MTEIPYGDPLYPYFAKAQTEFRTNGETFQVDIKRPWPVQQWMLCSDCEGSGMSRYWVECSEVAVDGNLCSDTCATCEGIGMKPEIYALIRGNLGPHRDAVLAIKTLGSRLHRAAQTRRKEETIDEEDPLLSLVEETVQGLLDWVTDVELRFIPSH